MRMSFARWMVAILAVVSASPAFAQRPRIKVVEANIGLPPGRFVSERNDAQQSDHLRKRNTWAPIYLRLEMLGEVPGTAKVTIEAHDIDDLRTTISFPLGNFSDRKPGEQISAGELASIPYVRFTGQGSGDVILTITSDEPDTRGRSLAEPVKIPIYRSQDLATYIVTSIGSKLPGFDLPRNDQQAGGANVQTRGPLRNGRVEHAAIETVRMMPDQWFGYACTDLVVLSTGSIRGEFLGELFSEQGGEVGRSRRAALLEWVRRGGRLVISAGSNAGILSQYPAFQEILPAKLLAKEPNRNVTELPLKWQFFGGRAQNEVLKSRGDPFPVARIAPDVVRPPHYLIPQTDARGRLDRDLAELPAVVQSSFGLGKITFVAFDLDRSPFLEFPAKSEFWDWLVRTGGQERASVGGGDRLNEQYGYYGGDRENEFSTALRTYVDTFDGVPVISFGWVALFIIMYTLLIGPVEYLILKKVFGRLELTWITFPLIVLTVSATAYFTAYAIKGSDLKLNKVDVVDVDPASGRVYGQSYFTIFSPRIDSYTIGVEPREGWTVARPGLATPPTLVDWMGGTEGGSPNIVSRGYSYHNEPADRVVADGLVGVPIQVWSTKAFSANWSGYLDPGTPIIESRLYHPPGQPTGLQGSFVNRLPVSEIQDAMLIYGGKAYKVGTNGTLAYGQQVTPVLDQSAGDWFRNAAQWPIVEQFTRGGYGTSSDTAARGVTLPMWGMLFQERSASSDSRLMNATMRMLDQSWRVKTGNDQQEGVYLNEAILVGRVEANSASAEDTMTDPNGPSPTKLWLKGLPSEGKPRQPVPGTLRQDTYIRAYLPVAGKPR